MHSLLTLLVAVILFSGMAALFYSTRAAVHTYDAFTYMVDVESKPIQALYHPHHLLYGPADKLAAEFAVLLGYDGRVGAPIQALNALAGAGGVLFLWGFLATFTRRRWESLPLALLLGLCYGYWIYAAEVEVYTLAAMFITLALWLAVMVERSGRLHWVALLGLSSAGAVMFHQTNLLFFAPVVLFLLSQEGWRKKIPVYVVVGGLGVIVPYALVAFSSKLTTWQRFYDWATGYAQTGRWGNNLSLETWPALRTGLTQVVALTEWHAVLFYALALVGLALGGYVLWQQKRRGWLALWFGWLVLYGGFFWWWEPWNIEFWIVLLPLWVMAMGMGLLLQKRYRLLIPLVAIILAVLLLRGHRDPVRALGDPANDYYYNVTAALVPQLTPDDLVVTRGNILDLYVPYYGEHPQSNLLALSNLNYDTGDYAAFIAALFERVAAAHRVGQLVYVDQILLDEPRSADRNPFGLEQADIDRFMQEFPVIPAVEFNGSNVFFTVGQRASPQTRTWTFADHLGGWRAFAVNAPRFEDGSWCFDGGGDVWLESPPLVIDTAEISTVDVDMFLAEAATEGQIFWRRADDADLSEGRSVHFSLENGRQRYAVKMANNVEWAGEVVFLRMDPIPENLDVTTCLYGIELLP